MPPKNASKGGGNQSKKADSKKKEKIIEDKTFGLKNKKGTKQQKFIQQVEHQVKSGGTKSAKVSDKEKDDKKKTLDTKKLALLEINSLFRPVQQQATTKGGDPKSLLCAFYKQGGCSKGSKCKFSHDLNVERKSEKRSAYVDIREDGEKETSEDWDEEKLQEVIEKKHAKEKSLPTTTEIVCRNFLDAVENGKYGWFWECPNGGSCKYRHALPPGFVLKKDRKKMDSDIIEISLEELIEKERAALGHDTTKVTLETFLAWKRKKLKEKDENEQQENEKKKKDYNSGREAGLSGREMFTFNPELAHNHSDDEDGDDSFDVNNISENGDDENGEEDNEPQIHFREIDYGALLAEYQDVDCGNISKAAPDRLQSMKQVLSASSNGNGNDDKEEADGAIGGNVDIDEDLFDDDDDELDELEEELNSFEMS